MHALDRLQSLLRDRVLDPELAALLSLLLEARTPLVAVGRDAAAGRRVIEGLAGLLPPGARLAEVAPDDDFAWLPEATELGWRRERGGRAAGGERLSSSDGVLIAHGLGAPGGVAGVGGERARIVVRALALGYGLLATMDGAGLDDALDALGDPAIGTDPDERSRLGVVLVLGEGPGTAVVTAAHYVRPVARDTHGHLQRPAPAVLATWNPGSGRYDHFAWGVMADLAGRLRMTPLDVEREQAVRAAALRETAQRGG